MKLSQWYLRAKLLASCASWSGRATALELQALSARLHNNTVLLPEVPRVQRRASISSDVQSI